MLACLAWCRPASLLQTLILIAIELNLLLLQKKLSFLISVFLSVIRLLAYGVSRDDAKVVRSYITS